MNPKTMYACNTNIRYGVVTIFHACKIVKLEMTVGTTLHQQQNKGSGTV